MTPERWQQIDRLFHATLACEPTKRAGFLASACAGDDPLRLEVESLISFHEDAQSFIETPAGDVAAELLGTHKPRFEPGQQIDNYKIVRQLGSGGMGEVYLADDTRLDRKIALKLLPPQFTIDAGRVRRFEQEARAASALNHPNIVTIHEIGQSNSAHFIATEFIDGVTLREHLASADMTLAKVLDVAAQVASALAAAHEAGIVHRDIKPENIMLRRDGFIKVLDFGLAKLVSHSVETMGSQAPPKAMLKTDPGMVMGTVQYMSPEQARGEDMDPRTDIWSLGVVLYEMLTGRVPFTGETPSHVIVSILEAEPTPMRRYVEAPAELERIVIRALNKKRNERYQTATDLASDLKSLRQELEVEARLKRVTQPKENGLQERSTLLSAVSPADMAAARPASSAEYLVREIKHHKTFAVAALLVLLVGAIGLPYFLINRNKTNSSASGKKSIAVLPLKPINVANRDDIYEIGIADSLIHQLGSMKGFVVRPLSAMRKYAGIEQDPIAAGREQQVDYVLASNYQLADGRIRITSQLFNVANGQIEETYKSEKEARDVFAMQDAIAGEVGNILSTRFVTTSSSPTAKRGTTNEEAYRLYLHGKNLNARQSAADALKAVEYFEQAIRLDPNFALAYSGLAGAYVYSSVFGVGLPHVENEKAKKALEKAFELDNNLAETYAVRGDLRLKYEWNLVDAEKDLLRAIELEPNNDHAHWLYALISIYRRRFDRALAEIEIALTIDPGSLMYQRDRGRILYYARRYDEAIVQLERVIELDGNFVTAYSWLWTSYEMKGDYAGAYEIFMRTQKRANPDRVEIYQKTYETAGWQGVRRKILEFAKLNEQEPGSVFYLIAILSAQLGEKDQAFQYLNKAVEKHEWWIVMLNVDPPLDPLRDDPRFAELVRRVGLK